MDEITFPEGFWPASTSLLLRATAVLSLLSPHILPGAQVYFPFAGLLVPFFYALGLPSWILRLSRKQKRIVEEREIIQVIVGKEGAKKRKREKRREAQLGKARADELIRREDEVSDTQVG